MSYLTYVQSNSQRRLTGSWSGRIVLDASTTVTVPKGARPAARVLLLDQTDRVLYLHAREQQGRREFWVLPGGGLEASEGFEEAAARELSEETGIEAELGPCIWTRHHMYKWAERDQNQFEVFFLARTMTKEIRPANHDSYVFGHRWWSLEELQQSDEHFAPTRIANLLGPILNGNLPSTPYDCGV